MAKRQPIKIVIARDFVLEGQVRIIKEILSIFDSCYKMGVYHAYKSNDNAECRQFLYDMKKLDPLQFQTLESDFIRGRESWCYYVSSWVSESPFNNKQLRLLRARSEINRLEKKPKGHNVAIAILLKEFYLWGIEQYVDNPNKKEVLYFMGNSHINWITKDRQDQRITSFKAIDFVNKFLNGQYDEESGWPKIFRSYSYWISPYYKFNYAYGEKK